MTHGELLSISVAGFSIVLALLLLVAFSGRIHDSRPLAKIRVRSDNRYRRAAPPVEENDAVGPPGFLVGLLLTLLALAVIFSLLNQP